MSTSPIHHPGGDSASPTSPTSEKPDTASDASTLHPTSTASTRQPPAEMQSHHKERHSKHSDLVRDAIIGFSDGLTVPFALTAGLSSLGSSRLVVLAGLAELFSGAISMGLGAFLAGLTDRKHYEVEEAREWREVRECPKAEEEEIYELLGAYGVGREAGAGVVESLKHNEDMWVKFMMDHELRLSPPPSHPWVEGLVMGFSYMLGGLLPMIPYFILHRTSHALFVSIGITGAVLVAFGYAKALVTGTGHRDACWSAVQTLVVGAIAAAVSWGIVRGINSVEKL